ncbi:MAG: response regulator [Spirochaetales bacterium]|nr:response regulator [Spirochaetales bacterium]
MSSFLYVVLSSYLSETKSGKILLAEDNLEVRTLCETILNSAGYKVTAASSGDQALELIESGKYNFELLLTDIIMPGINGKELHEKALEFIPELKVLFMSGYTDNVIDIHFNFKKGRNFIQKPFSNRDLLKKIKDIM